MNEFHERVERLAADVHDLAAMADDMSEDEREAVRDVLSDLKLTRAKITALLGEPLTVPGHEPTLRDHVGEFIHWLRKGAPK